MADCFCLPEGLHPAEKKKIKNQVLHGFIKARDLFLQAVMHVLNNHEGSIL